MSHVEPRFAHMDTTPRRAPGKTRAMVRRYYNLGWPIKRIAARLDVSPQMVTVHVRNLRDAGEINGRRS